MYKATIMVREDVNLGPSVVDSETARDLIRNHIVDDKQEHFVVLFLDTKNHLLASELVHLGGVSASVVDPRTVFSKALRHGAAKIIVGHNHPSGDPNPSMEDLVLTERLGKAGDILALKLVDHIVLGNGSDYSMRAAGVSHWCGESVL